MVSSLILLFDTTIKLTFASSSTAQFYLFVCSSHFRFHRVQVESRKNKLLLIKFLRKYFDYVAIAQNVEANETENDVNMTQQWRDFILQFRCINNTKMGQRLKWLLFSLMMSVTRIRNEFEFGKNMRFQEIVISLTLTRNNFQFGFFFAWTSFGFHFDFDIARTRKIEKQKKWFCPATMTSKCDDRFTEHKFVIGNVQVNREFTDLWHIFCALIYRCVNEPYSVRRISFSYFQFVWF